MKKLERQTRVLVVGDLMLDQYIIGEMTRVSPETACPVIRETSRYCVPGGAASAAVRAAELGADVTVCGLIGKDSAGGTLRHVLHQHRNLTVQCPPARDTTTKTRVMVHTPSGQQQHSRSDRDINATKNDQRTLLSWVCNLFRVDEFDVVLLSDYGRGSITRELVEAVTGGEYGMATVIVDPAGARHLSDYHGCDVIKLNRLEAGVGDSFDDLSETLEVISECCGAETVFVTLDAGGLIVRQESEEIHIPASGTGPYEGWPMDVTGAGDQVAAALAVYWPQYDWRKAARLANHSAQLSIRMYPDEYVTAEDMADEPVVFTNGCFDLLHPGHVQFLEQAAKLGRLVVAVNSDASVARLKGPGRPVQDIDQRVKMLEALACVDEVIVMDADTPDSLLSSIQPEFLVKGGTTEEIVGRGVVESYGGEVRRLDEVPGYSTTGLISQMAVSPDP